MSGSLAPSPPPQALLCWVDDRSVYIQVPVKNNPMPLIQSYPLTEGGLSKALNFLRIRYEELPSYQRNYTPSKPPITPKDGKPPIQTDEQRMAALAILRKLGLA